MIVEKPAVLNPKSAIESVRDVRREIGRDLRGELPCRLKRLPFGAADGDEQAHHRAVGATQAYAVENRVHLVPVLVRHGAPAPLIPVDHELAVAAVLHDVAVGLEGGRSVRGFYLDRARLIQLPTGAGQTVERTVVGRARALRQVVADVERGRATVCSRVLARD